MADTPPDFIIKRPIYHGTNTKFDNLDFQRGGGFVHFAEDPSVAWRYANDLGSGGRNRKAWEDIRVEDLDTGQNFNFDKDKQLWISSDGKKVFKHSEFKKLMDDGDRYFEAYPKDARILAAKVDMSKILDTHPNRISPYYTQANKKGLEQFLDIVDPSKIENVKNPQFTNISKRYVERLRQSAQDELKNIPGSPGFGNTFWSTTKFAKSDEINQAMQGVSDQLKKANFDAIRFADDSHPTIAMMKQPESYINLLRSRAEKAKKGISSMANLLGQAMAPYVPTVLKAGTAASILASKSPAEAAFMEAINTIVPGGVSEMGVSDHQKELDRQYFEAIRKSSNRRPENAAQKR